MSSRLSRLQKGGIKTPVVCATTANITLSGLQTIDGVTVADGDRVLVKNQTTTTENGIYDASASAWTRSGDWNDSNDAVNGMLVLDANDSTAVYRVTFTGTYTLGTTVCTFTDINASFVADATAQAVAAAASAAAALVSENNAETAETNAETAETNAETAETNAAASAVVAAASAASAAAAVSGYMAKATYDPSNTAANVYDKANHVGVEQIVGTIISPTALSAQADNYNPADFATSNMVRLSASGGNRVITGFAAPSAGVDRIFYLCNIGTTYNLTFNHEYASSTAANRILLKDGNNRSLKPYQTGIFWYDHTSARWRTIADFG